MAKRNDYYKLKLTTLRNESKCILFDIAFFKSELFFSCSYIKARKIPVKEQSFLIAQRTARRLIIGPIQYLGTKKMRQKNVSLNNFRDIINSKQAGLTVFQGL